MPRTPVIDITGQSFGRWTAIERAGNDRIGSVLWRCRCACGVTRDVLGKSLRSGASSSCGCLTRERSVGRSIHGEAGTRLHRIWAHMRQRCVNPNDAGFPLYGGRGINVCKEWDDYVAFRDWALSAGYADNLSIERIDVDGGYSPENCTWADALTQSANRRFVQRAPDGELWWHKAQRNGITAAAYRTRVYDGWPLEEACSSPMGLRRVERKRGAGGKFV